MNAPFRLRRFLREIAERISRAVDEVDTGPPDPLDTALQGFMRGPGGLLNVSAAHEAGHGPKIEVREDCLLAVDWPEMEDDDPLYWRLLDEQDAASAVSQGIAAPRFMYWLDRQGRLLAVEATAIEPHQMTQFHATFAWERRDDEPAQRFAIRRNPILALNLKGFPHFRPAG